MITEQEEKILDETFFLLLCIKEKLNRLRLIFL